MDFKVLLILFLNVFLIFGFRNSSTSEVVINKSIKNEKDVTDCQKNSIEINGKCVRLFRVSDKIK